MQSRARTYAEVFLASLEEASSGQRSKIAKKCVRLLKKRGDLRIAGSVLREIKRMQEERSKKAVVITASPMSLRLRSTMERMCKKQSLVLEERISPDILGGAAIFVGKEMLVDNTLRTRIRNLFNVA